MANLFTEVTRVGWFGRARNSVGGAVFGVVLFLLAIALLFWNEGRAVQTAQSLEEGKSAFVEADAGAVNPANEGKLVHLTAQTRSDETLHDTLFGVSANAIKLSRNVEMYQWTQRSATRTRRELGGGEERTTDYTYQKEWKPAAVDSSAFKVPLGHENPAMTVQSQTLVAEKVMAGPYLLSSNLKNQIGAFEPLAANEAVADGFRLVDGTFYKGANPAAPEVGDMRVSFQVVRPGTVSLLARQAGATFGPYQSHAGDTLEELMVGAVDGKGMFTQLEQQNTALTWGMRAAGFFFMWIGCMLIATPLRVLADVVPFVGSLVGAGVALLSGLLASVLSLVTIAVAWIFYRPLLGIALLLLAGAGVWVITKVNGNRRTSPASTAKTAR
jgi:hypothetical protein